MQLREKAPDLTGKFSEKWFLNADVKQTQGNLFEYFYSASTRRSKISICSDPEGRKRESNARLRSYDCGYGFEFNYNPYIVSKFSSGLSSETILNLVITSLGSRPSWNQPPLKRSSVSKAVNKIQENVQPKNIILKVDTECPGKLGKRSLLIRNLSQYLNFFNCINLSVFSLGSCKVASDRKPSVFERVKFKIDIEFKFHSNTWKIRSV